MYWAFDIATDRICMCASVNIGGDCFLTTLQDFCACLPGNSKTFLKEIKQKKYFTTSGKH